MGLTSRLSLGACLILSAILLAAVAARMFWNERGGSEANRAPDQARSGPADLESLQADRLEEGVKEEMPAFDPIKRLGWRIWGKVTKPLLRPLAGARVVLRVFDGSRFREATGPVLTDEKGRYTAFIPAAQTIRLFPPDEILPMEIHGDAAASGHRPNYNFLTDLPHPDRSETPLRLDFMLKEGGRLEGRLITATDRPVADGSVFVLLPGKNWKEAAQTGPDGIYTLPVDQAGRIHLFAAKSDEGMAPPVSVEVDPSADGAAPDLILREYGSIRGRIEYPDGRPVDRIVIHAAFKRLLEDGLQDLDAYGLSEHFLRAEHLPPNRKEYRGLPFASAETDQEGWFLMKGLEPGSYLLWAPDRSALNMLGSAASHTGPLFTCETGSPEVRMVLDLYRVRVILRDREGYRIPLADLTFDSEQVGGTERVAGGWIDRRVAPGPLRLTASTKSGLYADGEMVVSEGDHAPVKELVLEERPPAGRVHLVLQDAGGAPLAVPPAMTALLTGKTNGLQIDLSSRQRDQQGGYVLSLLPDLYDLVLFPDISADTLPDSWYMPASAKGFSVASGKVTRVPVQLRRGGRLGLKLNPSDAITGPGSFKIEAVHIEKGRSEALSHFLPGGKPPAVSCARLEPGIPYLNTKLFEPGAYRLEVRFETRLRTSKNFQILPGEVTEIELSFDE